eukprot:TRINITY_DN10350_c0_g1_i6.p2 TRINITY_DN10350_c0_g1~~TRINITY_DN10350_c0_g1_i6.p2  ORF type:complete len:102 (-),score=19.17 TRINITY_DN10350_c0_g1_i6:24-329(-)
MSFEKIIVISDTFERMSTSPNESRTDTFGGSGAVGRASADEDEVEGADSAADFGSTAVSKAGGGEGASFGAGGFGGKRPNKQIGRAVQQECRDRSRMPSSA